MPTDDSFGNTAAVIQTREGPKQEQQKTDGMEVGGAWGGYRHLTILL